LPGETQGVAGRQRSQQFPELLATDYDRRTGPEQHGIRVRGCLERGGESRIAAQPRRSSVGGQQGSPLVLSGQRGGYGQQQESQSTPGWGSHEKVLFRWHDKKPAVILSTTFDARGDSLACG
jgi:hypothetical protein